MKNMHAVVLAAGFGKRMKSSISKMLHPVLGKPIIDYPVELASKMNFKSTIVVVGHMKDDVESHLKTLDKAGKITSIWQKEQRGTGHAVMTALKKIKAPSGILVILNGDVVLLDKATLGSLVKKFEKSNATLAFLTFNPEDPTGYGRIIRKNKDVVCICEHNDCTKKQREIAEVNAGIYAIDIAFLRASIKNLKSNNSQNELYLTDLVENVAENQKVVTLNVSEKKVMGINDRCDLAQVEKIMSGEINEKHMKNGVTIQNPKTVRIESDVKIGRDTVVESGACITGSTSIGKNCKIGMGTAINNSKISGNVTIEPYCAICEAEVEKNASIGPFGRLRPGTHICQDAKVGNFVELKRTVLGKGSKANHLTYLGDGEIGKNVNIGAGTIFCNYDGYNKYKTVLDDGVFIGSNSQIVAPVKVGKNSYVASGSTITEDVPPESLALGRSRQKNKVGVATLLKKMLKSKKTSKN